MVGQAMDERENRQKPAHYPKRVPIDAYGNGGFRFAEMSHRGSLLALPSGMHAWDGLPDQAAEAMQPSFFNAVFQEAGAFEFLLLGTGQQHEFPDPDLQEAFANHKIGLETMTTGAACRTYNVLLAEGRPVAAALLAVT